MLNAEVDNKITFYIDPRIKNEFMATALEDVRCATAKEIKTTDKQVLKHLFKNLLVFFCPSTLLFIELEEV